MLRYGRIPAIDNIACVLINTSLQVFTGLAYVLDPAFLALDYINNAISLTVYESLDFVSIIAFGVLDLSGF